MKKILLISLLAILSATPAYADRGGGRGAGHFGGHGGGWGWGGLWVVPALIGGAILYDVTRPQTVYVQPAPVAYAPNYAPAMAASSVQYWYFCPAANAYYPYVTSCPSGWQSVPATPHRY